MPDTLFPMEDLPVIAPPAPPEPSRQNRSTAVMQRRAATADGLDDFPTPPWAVRALCLELEGRFGSLGRLSVREPAANRGHMVRPLREHFPTVLASDVADYGAGFPVFDYLDGVGPLQPTDWTITNPPYAMAEAFIERAFATSRRGVAMLLRIAFLEGIGRHARLFLPCRPNLVLQFSERVVMQKNRLAPDGSTATAYAWFVWDLSAPARRSEIDWIGPCREELEHTDDYPGFQLLVTRTGRRKWMPEAPPCALT